MTTRELNVLKGLGYTSNDMVALYSRVTNKDLKSLKEVVGSMIDVKGIGKVLAEFVALDVVLNG